MKASITLLVVQGLIESHGFSPSTKILHQHQHTHTHAIRPSQQVSPKRHRIRFERHQIQGSSSYKRLSSGVMLSSMRTSEEETKTTDKTEEVKDDEPSIATPETELLVDSESQKDDLPSQLNSLQRLQTQFKNSLFLGIEPTPEIVAIMTIYFVQGALGLARLAQTFLLKDELHLGPAEMSALTGIFTLPWTIKPLYGFLSDGVPLFGLRRRSYLILCAILGTASYALLGTNFGGVLPPDNITPTLFCLVLSSACIAFSDVVADGIVVQATRDSDDPSVAGGLQSLCWGSAAAGGLLSSYFSGSLLELLSPRNVFAISAILPLLVGITAFSIQEPTIPEKQKGEEMTNVITEQIQDLWSAMKQESIWKPTLFLFLWRSTPTSDGAFLYFLTDDLGFGPEFLGRVRLVTSAAGLLGVWCYQKYLRTVPIKTILFWSGLLSAPLGLTSLLLITHANRLWGIPDGWFVLGDDVVLAVLGQVAFLPTLVLAAKLCPPGVEAVLFATLMSVFNGAATVGTEVGAGLTKWLGVTETNFENLALLTVLCNVSSLYPLLFIGWLDGVGDQSVEEMEKEPESADNLAESD